MNPRTPPHRRQYSPLEKKYKLILAWCVFVDGSESFIKKRLHEAEDAGAPLDAYSMRPDGTWRTIQELAETDPGTAQALKDWARFVK
jgi:hypothetical protein